MYHDEQKWNQKLIKRNITCLTWSVVCSGRHENSRIKIFFFFWVLILKKEFEMLEMLKIPRTCIETKEKK